MRLHLRLHAEHHCLSFDYQHELVRSFHRWLPDNDIHNDISLYSLSWLSGSKAEHGQLHFPHGAGWSISFHDERIAKHLLVGILRNPDTTFGMRVVDVQIQEAPDFGDKHRFLAASPILAKQYDGKRIQHKIFSDENVDEILTHTLRTKLSNAGINADVQVQFDRDFVNPKTKLVTIKNVKNRASMCPVIVEGHPDAVSFAWSVGIGHCTGVGFGAIC